MRTVLISTRSSFQAHTHNPLALRFHTFLIKSVEYFTLPWLDNHCCDAGWVSFLQCLVPQHRSLPWRWNLFIWMCIRSSLRRLQRACRQLTVLKYLNIQKWAAGRKWNREHMGGKYCESNDSKPATCSPHPQPTSQSSQVKFFLLWVDKENLI